MSTKFTFLALLFLGQFVFAQTAPENETEIEESKTKIGFINFSAGTPLYFGDNAASEAYKYNANAQLGAYFYITNHIVAGASYSITTYDVDMPQEAGFIDDGNVQYFTLEGGYNVSLSNKFDILATAGPGYVVYKNMSQDASFNDSGFSFTINSALSYNLTSKIDAFFSARFYLDSLSVEAPAATESFFDNAAGFYPSIGFRFHLYK